VGIDANDEPRLSDVSRRAGRPKGQSCGAVRSDRQAAQRTSSPQRRSLSDGLRVSA